MTTKFLAGGSVEKIEDKFWQHKQRYFSWFLRGKTWSKIYEICKLPVNFVLEILSFPEILKRISLLIIFCVIMNNDQQHQEKNHRTERENQGISRGMSISLKLFLAWIGAESIVVS